MALNVLTRDPQPYLRGLRIHLTIKDSEGPGEWKKDWKISDAFEGLDLQQGRRTVVLYCVSSRRFSPLADLPAVEE